MRWCNSFARSVFFAVLVALAYPAYRLVIGPATGDLFAFASYSLFSAALYLFGVARRPTLGLAAAIITLACGSTLLLLGATGREVVLAAALLVGVLRSGLLYTGAPFARRFALEGCLLVAGLVLGAALWPDHSRPGGLVFWGFFLAQGGFFLVRRGDRARRAAAEQMPPPDPFAAACDRARELLEQRTHETH